jgi:hypothetical protein
MPGCALSCPHFEVFLGCSLPEISMENSNLMDELATPIYWINLMYELSPHVMTLILENAK